MIPPSGIYVEDDTLHFDTVEDALYYTVKINDNIVDIITNSYDISFLEINQSYQISINSNSGEESSEYSSPITYEIYTSSGITIHSTFNINSDYDLIVAFEDQLDLEIHSVKYNNINLSEDLYSFTNDELIISEEHLKTYTEDIIFDIYTNEGITILNISLEDILKPYLKGQSEIVFMLDSLDDITVVFELCGGSFISLSGFDITEDDYSVVNGVLTINNSYITTVLDSLVEETFMLGYYLENDSIITIGYLFITKAYPLVSEIN
jgi:hypothetical protein